VLNEMIEFHDSNIMQVEVSNSNSMRILMRAYIHKSKGIPGIDPGTGWVQNAELQIKLLYSYGGVPAIRACIVSGMLVIAEKAYLNEIPIPLNCESIIYFSVILDDGSSFSVEGQGITLTLLGEAQYIEEFSGSSTNE
jgi:hypothetical protein